MQAVDLAQLGEQLVERGLAVQILAVARGVLRDDVQLAHAVGGKTLCLFNKIFYFSAAEFSAYHRDRAERTFVIAALGDFEIGGIERRGQHSAAQLVGEQLERAVAAEHLLHHVGDLLIGADAHSRVDLIELLGDLVLIALRKTAGDDDRLDLALALEVAQLDDLVDALLLGGVDKAAGVHNDRVRLGRIVNDRIAASAQREQQHLRIDLIFCTAQRDYADLFIHKTSFSLNSSKTDLISSQP